jgi:uncharacterized protein (TIGR02466 family)
VEAMNRSVETLFPSVIQICEVERAEALNRRLLKKIDEIRAESPNSRPESWTSTVYTTLNSADQLHQLPDFAELRDAILRESSVFADALRINHMDYPLRITDCWINVYGPKDGQESHQHMNSIISGSYYVKAPNDCAGIMFHSPMADAMLVPPYTEITPYNSLGVEVPVREGLMVLFRSWLKHSVRPSPVAEERISISFNLAM